MTKNAIPAPFAPGTKVTLLEGTFAGWPGVIAQDWDARNGVGVILTLFGREVPVHLEVWQLDPPPPPGRHEFEWPLGTPLAEMIAEVRYYTSRRKVRLFGVACCRRVSHLFTADRCRTLWDRVEQAFFFTELPEEDRLPPDFLTRAVDQAEQWAEGGPPPEGLGVASRRASDLYRFLGDYYASHDDDEPIDHDLMATCEAAGAIHAASSGYLRLDEAAGHAARAVARTTSRATWQDGSPEPDPAELAAQGDLLRDIYCRPARLLTVPPEWLTPLVQSLAGQAYDTRRFELLPVLADALEDAGCTDAELLAHLRGPRPHVRGCWAVDLLTGRG